MTSRKHRSLSQKMYIVDWAKTNDPFGITFDIMGTTGNIYKTSICDKPICNCPDFLARGVRCKHIYFTLIKALKVGIDDADDKYFDQDEIIKMKGNLATIYKSDISKSDVFRQEYLKRKDKFIPGKMTDNCVKQKELDDVCPICLDDFEENEDDEIIFCKYSCGANYHIECIDIFKKASKGKLKCTLCQNPWDKTCKILPKYVNMHGIKIPDVIEKKNGCDIL